MIVWSVMVSGQEYDGFYKGGDSQMSSENYRLFSTPIYWKMKDLFSKNVFYFVNINFDCSGCDCNRSLLFSDTFN